MFKNWINDRDTKGLKTEVGYGEVPRGLDGTFCTNFTYVCVCVCVKYFLLTLIQNFPFIQPFILLLCIFMNRLFVVYFYLSPDLRALLSNSTSWCETRTDNMFYVVRVPSFIIVFLFLLV